MGNILTQKRHKRDGTKIEDLSYVYHTSGGKLVRNRLYHLDDVVGSGVDATDIDDMGTYDADAQDINTLNNYVYDEEGRLVKDVQEKISKIVWRVDGKVKEIQRATGSTKWLKFDYDAMGNRIAKHVYNNTGTTHERSTYYILDAQGNQISTYDHEVVSETAQFNLKERNIFGSSRIGSKQDSLNVLTATLTQNYTQILGTKYYEFSNHLGNVLTVFSDVKIALDADANGAVDGFRVPIRNIADYSPFGVQLDGRTISMDSYRYGYQGSEKDDEAKGGGNSYTTFFRQLDPRVGRWFSVDPVFQPWQSPYCSMDGNPIMFNDVLGDEIGVGKKKKEINKEEILRKTETMYVPSEEKTKIIDGNGNYLKSVTVFSDNKKELTNRDKKKLERQSEKIDRKNDKIEEFNNKIQKKIDIFRNDKFDFDYNESTGVLENPRLKSNVNSIDDNSVLGILFQTMESDKTYNLRTNKVPWQQVSNNGLKGHWEPNSFAFNGKNGGAISERMLLKGNSTKLQILLAADATEFLGKTSHKRASFALFLNFDSNDFKKTKIDFNFNGIQFMYKNLRTNDTKIS
ncbi:MAG: hypothetical protein FGM14_16985, partial [Flavobacteriales bacterium]|nr:hypothetical protein [Flavobacteriales bacterium]